MEINLIIIFIFSSIGILNTLYLSYHKIQKSDVTCPFFPNEWCKIVQHSSYSKTLGIPNSYAGFIMYLLIFILMILLYSGFPTFGLIKIIIIFGLFFSMYFTYIQAFILKAFCTWCVLSAINFIIMFIALYF